MITNRPEVKGLLAGYFLEVSGFDGDDEDKGGLVPLETIDRIVPDADDPDVTWVVRKDGYEDAYIKKPLSQVKQDLT